MSAVSRAQRVVRGAALAVSLAILTLGGGAMAANVSETAPIKAAPAAAEAAPVKPGDSAMQDYAAREQAQAARQLQDFQGGDLTIIIGSSAVLLVILIIVLVILL